MIWPVAKTVINAERQKNIDSGKHKLVDGRLLSSLYGPRSIGDGFHDGIDILPVVYGGIGDTVVACHDGRVAASYYSKSYGNVIIIDADKYSTLYAHLSKRDLVVGEKVKAGDKIGTMGNTGTSGVHLHLEYRDETYSNPRGGTYWNSHSGEYYSSQDPLDYLKPDEVQEKPKYTTDDIARLYDKYKASDAALKSFNEKYADMVIEMEDLLKKL